MRIMIQLIKPISHSFGKQGILQRNKGVRVPEGYILHKLHTSSANGSNVTIGFLLDAKRHPQIKLQALQMAEPQSKLNALFKWRDPMTVDDIPR